MWDSCCLYIILYILVWISKLVYVCWYLNICIAHTLMHKYVFACKSVFMCVCVVFHITYHMRMPICGGVQTINAYIYVHVWWADGFQCWLTVRKRLWTWRFVGSRVLEMTVWKTWPKPSSRMCCACLEMKSAATVAHQVSQVCVWKFCSSGIWHSPHFINAVRFQNRVS